MIYGDSHRYLLRTIASQGVISFGKCKEICKALPDLSGTTIETVISDINKVIKPYQQLIKIVIDELTLERKIVFLCLGYDDATKSQNMFSAKELDYFRILIEKIMTTENREIDIMTALNLADKVKPALKKTDAEVILKTWCTIHYLDRNDTCYALGIRAIHEFERYLQENMPDTIQNCSVCQKIVFRGVNCPLCDESVHTSCLNTYVQKVKKWPCCRAQYGEEPSQQDNSTALTQTQLLQTQLIQGHSSHESMDISEANESELSNSSGTGKRRKRKRISSD